MVHVLLTWIPFVTLSELVDLEKIDLSITQRS